MAKKEMNFKLYGYNVNFFNDILNLHEEYLSNFDAVKGLPLKSMDIYAFYESLLTYTDDWSNQWLNKPEKAITKKQILEILIKDRLDIMDINKINTYIKVYKIEQEIKKQCKIN